MYQDTGAEHRSNVPRYYDVFRRHKFLTILPIVLALGASVPLALMKPHKYTSTTTVWFDTAVPNASSLDPGQAYSGLPPAQAGQAVIQELLATRNFLVAIGTEGPLAARLKAKHVPLATLDDRIVATLGRAFSTAPVGPQVLQISMTGPDPSIITGSLNALVAQYSAQIGEARNSRAAAQLLYYKNQLGAKQKALTIANDTLTEYQAAHPNAVPANDVKLQQLSNIVDVAQADLTTTNNAYQQAQLAQSNIGSKAAFHVIDEPLAPIAQGRMKKIALHRGRRSARGADRERARARRTGRRRPHRAAARGHRGRARPRSRRRDQRVPPIRA